MNTSLVVLLAVVCALSAGFLAGLASMRSCVRRATKEAAHARWLADHDALTGLPNRTGARRHYHRAAQAGLPYAIVLLDLDDFKSVNDTWGHHAGDAHLVAVAERLAAACQQVGATACRLGGDEFVLLLPPTDPQCVLRQATAIVDGLGAALPLIVDGHGLVLTHPSASAGIAVAESGDTFSDLLRHADIALYHAKRHGSAPCLYAPHLHQPPSHRHKAAEAAAVRAETAPA